MILISSKIEFLKKSNVALVFVAQRFNGLARIYKIYKWKHEKIKYPEKFRKFPKISKTAEKIFF